MCACVYVCVCVQFVCIMLFLFFTIISASSPSFVLAVNGSPAGNDDLEPWGPPHRVKVPGRELDGEAYLEKGADEIAEDDTRSSGFTRHESYMPRHPKSEVPLFFPLLLENVAIGSRSVYCLVQYVCLCSAQHFNGSVCPFLDCLQYKRK